MKPLLQEISKFGEFNLVILSFEKWNMGNISSYLDQIDVHIKFINVPRTSNEENHFRNSNRILSELASLKYFIRKLYLELPGKSSICVYHFLGQFSLLGAWSIAKLHIPNLIGEVYIQKHVVSDLDFIHISQGFKFHYSKSFLTLLYSFFWRKLNFSDFLFLLLLFPKHFIVEKRIQRLKFYGCYSISEKLKIEKYYNYSNIDIIPNLELSLFEKQIDATSHFFHSDHIYFYTSGAFKYTNSKYTFEYNLILRIIQQLNERERLRKVILCTKPGEKAKLENLFESFGAVEVFENPHIPHFDRSRNLTIFSPLISSVTIKLLFLGYPIKCYSINSPIENSDFYLSLRQSVEFIHEFNDVSISFGKSNFSQLIEFESVDFLRKKLDESRHLGFATFVDRILGLLV